LPFRYEIQLDIGIVLTPLLFARDLLFIDESQVVCVGHDCNPALFTKGGNGWEFSKQMDDKTGSGTGTKAKNSAFAIFANKVDKGVSAGASIETTLNTKHQNCIT